MADNTHSMVCQATVNIFEQRKPVITTGLTKNAAYFKMTDTQKREEVLKEMHKSCKGLCGCACHRVTEPPK
ncbi:MAG: hypothetical protein V3S68_03655 [Dehalococcoidia bacterium]